MAEDIDYKLLLECMVGASVSKAAGTQVAVDTRLPIKFPLSSIHYELYRNHVELHVESSSHTALCKFLDRKLPDNDISGKAERGFCKYAYVLKRRIEGWSDIDELGNAFIELRKIVEPVLLSYCNQVADNFALAKELADYYSKEKARLPFHINVIDELHASENAHTRILTRLLEYRTDGKRVVLSSFLSLVSNFHEDKNLIDMASVFFNQDYIDCLIECPAEFAVIIENKIHGATDQNKQIERYVMTELHRGIPADKIWVIYLTSDGSKHVDTCSLTAKANNILQDRFITLNYRNDILPWLKNSILPNCKLKEDWLITALKQYTDHLEGMYGLRSSQSEMRKKMHKAVTEALNLSDGASISERYEHLQDFASQIEALRNIIETSSSYLTGSAIDKLKKCTKEVFSELCPDNDIYFYNGISNGYFQVFITGWDDNVHFEWIPLSYKRLICGNSYTLVVHIEDKKIREALGNTFENDDATKTEGKGLGFHKIDNTTYYRKNITSSRSIAEMTHNELHKFLVEIYCDVPKLIRFIECHIAVH